MSDDIRAVMAIRDLLSAIQSLSDLDILDSEHDDIELAHAILGRIVKRNAKRKSRDGNSAKNRSLVNS